MVERRLKCLRPPVRVRHFLFRFCMEKKKQVWKGVYHGETAAGHGASVEELVRSIKYGMVVLDADKRHLDWKKAAEDFGIQELLKEYRRFRRKPKLTEREKLVITAYTGYVLEGTAGKVVDFVEQELGHSIQTPEPPAVPVVVEVRRALQEEFCEICRKHHIFDYI